MQLQAHLLPPTQPQRRENTIFLSVWPVSSHDSSSGPEEGEGWWATKQYMSTTVPGVLADVGNHCPDVKRGAGR